MEEGESAGEEGNKGWQRRKANKECKGNNGRGKEVKEERKGR